MEKLTQDILYLLDSVYHSLRNTALCFMFYWLSNTDQGDESEGLQREELYSRRDLRGREERRLKESNF